MRITYNLFLPLINCDLAWPLCYVCEEAGLHSLPEAAASSKTDNFSVRVCFGICKFEKPKKMDFMSWDTTTLRHFADLVNSWSQKTRCKVWLTWGLSPKWKALNSLFMMERPEVAKTQQSESRGKLSAGRRLIWFKEMSKVHCLFLASQPRFKMWNKVRVVGCCH